MKIKDIGEFGFIKKVTSDSVFCPEKILQAAGDDAAVFTSEPGKAIVVTTDILIENIHFIRNKISPEDLGHKAITVNLSDIAAMGANPEHAFVSLGIPEDLPSGYLERFYSSLKKTAKQFNVNILGGDTSASGLYLIINIALTGTSSPDNILYRHKAVPGDIIYSTGLLGSSRAGLQLLLDGITKPDNNQTKLINAHTRPYPYVTEGMFLSQMKGTRAAIDVSDGLVSDIGHIADESNCGFILESDLIPVSDSLKEFCFQHSYDLTDYAISGGEDYVLIFTVDSSCAKDVEKYYYSKFNKLIYRIGVITESKSRLLKTHNGRLNELMNKGWDHFKK
ncbi:MAG: thiamine-phosphate kinase [Spirochaetes bacterium]|nr:thiamine-phosphate kinase [Spirochaetota bacterium]